MSSITHRIPPVRHSSISSPTIDSIWISIRRITEIIGGINHRTATESGAIDAIQIFSLTNLSHEAIYISNASDVWIIPIGETIQIRLPNPTNRRIQVWSWDSNRERIGHFKSHETIPAMPGSKGHAIWTGFNLR